MTCRRIQPLLNAHVDGTASAEEREQVRVHVEACRECARSLEHSRQLVGMLAAAQSREVSASFESALRSAIEATDRAAPASAWWERFSLRFEWRLRGPAMVAAGSLAVALMAAVVPQVPGYVHTRQERGRYVASALERHHQIEATNRDVNWEAVDASIDLNTGSLLTP